MSNSKSTSKSTTIYKKALAVIESCKTEGHIMGATKYLYNASAFLHKGTIDILMVHLRTQVHIIKGLYTQGTIIERD